MLLIMQRALVGLEIEKRWSDGVLWSPCWDSHWWQLVWTYYMTVGFLQLSVSKLKLASAGVCTKRMLFLRFNMVKRLSSSFTIVLIGTFCHVRGKPKASARQSENHLWPKDSITLVGFFCQQLGCDLTYWTLGSPHFLSLYVSTDKAYLMLKRAKWS